MKYKAFENTNGQFCVTTRKAGGTGFGACFDTEQEAKEYALIQSMAFYQQQVDNAWYGLEKICPSNDLGEVMLTNGDSYSSKGDLLC